MKEFIEFLKAEGLDMLEDDVARFVNAGFKFGSAKLLASDNSIMMAIGGMLPLIKPVVMAGVDLIDGEDDEGR